MSRRLSFRRKTSTPQTFRSSVQLSSSMDPLEMTLLTMEKEDLLGMVNLGASTGSNSSRSTMSPLSIGSSSSSVINSLANGGSASWSYRSMKRLSRGSVAAGSPGGSPDSSSGNSRRSSSPTKAYFHVNEPWQVEVRHHDEVLRNLARHFLEPMRIHSQLKNLSTIGKSDSRRKSELKPVLVQREEPRVVPSNRRLTAAKLVQLAGTETSGAEKNPGIENKPPTRRLTLVEMARYQKLLRLASVLEDIVELEKEIVAWRSRNELSPEVKTLQADALKGIKFVTDDMVTHWSLGVLKSAASKCMEDSRAMEWRISQFHIHIEKLLEALAELAVSMEQRSIPSSSSRQLFECNSEDFELLASSSPSSPPSAMSSFLPDPRNPFPMSSAAVANLEMALPTKFPVYLEVLKDMKARDAH